MWMEEEVERGRGRWSARDRGSEEERGMPFEAFTHLPHLTVIVRKSRGRIQGKELEGSDEGREGKVEYGT